MPRNIGTGIYVIPPDTEGIPDQTIESVPYNFYIHDVETDLNNPRPIIAGGTGANDADEALVNLGAEKATQLVTNYDSHVWLPGSFRAAGSATAGPVDGHAFAGIVYLNEPYVNPPTNANVVVSARDMDDTVVPRRVYFREKKAGVWGLWSDIKAPTQLPNSNDTSIATTAFVTTAVAGTGLAAIEALAANGIQINGGMEVNQEKPFGVVSTADGQYIADGWKLNLVGTMVVEAASGIDILAQNIGFRSVLTLTVLTAQTSLGASDILAVSQPLEGYRISRLAWGSANAQPITIGFWSANQRTGIFSVSIVSSSRSYSTTYTQAAAGVMQYNVITVPGDTTGFRNDNQDLAFTIYFTIAAGTTRTAPTANVWLANPYYAAPGQINGASTLTGKAIFITGVVILPGIYTLPPARSSLLMRPYDQELQICKRYFQRIGGYNPSGNSTTDVWFGFYAQIGGEDSATTITLTPTMRNVPTVTQVGAWTATNVTVGLASVGIGSFVWRLTSGATGPAQNFNNSGAVPPILGGRFLVSARL